MSFGTKIVIRGRPVRGAYRHFVRCVVGMTDNRFIGGRGGNCGRVTVFGAKMALWNRG